MTMGSTQTSRFTANSHNTWFDFHGTIEDGRIYPALQHTISARSSWNVLVFFKQITTCLASLAFYLQLNPPPP